LRDDRLAQRFRGHVRDMPRAGAAVALNQRKHGGLTGRRAKGFVARLAADIAFVRFNHFVLAA
jgi:hypothetical protein